MTTRYLDPSNDVSFKKLFGTENHKNMLISFLNSILKLEGDRLIKKLEFLPQEQVPLIKDFKKTIIDVKCTDERNVEYIVEMQNNKVPGFIKRSQFYLSSCYAMQFRSGQSSYLTLQPVVLLALTNHILFPEKKSVVSYHKTLDDETLEHDLKDLVYVFVEIPKFIKTEGEIETPLEQWIYFFRNWEKSKEIPKAIQEPEVIEAYKTMEEFNWTIQEKDAYLQASISVIDEVMRGEKEKKEGHKEGKEEGLKEGLKEGRKEGHKKGHKQGRKEGEEVGEKKKALAIAKELLKKGMSDDEVSTITGLPPQEVQSLLKERV